MKPVTVAAFNGREEAEPLRQYLCAAGIWAEVRDDLDADGLWRFERPTAGVRLEVPREDFEAALALVYEWNAGGLPAAGSMGPLPPGAAPRPDQSSTQEGSRSG